MRVVWLQYGEDSVMVRPGRLPRRLVCSTSRREVSAMSSCSYVVMHNSQGGGGVQGLITTPESLISEL